MNYKKIATLFLILFLFFNNFWLSFWFTQKEHWVILKEIYLSRKNLNNNQVKQIDDLILKLEKKLISKTNFQQISEYQTIYTKISTALSKNIKNKSMVNSLYYLNNRIEKIIYDLNNNTKIELSVNQQNDINNSIQDFQKIILESWKKSFLKLNNVDTFSSYEEKWDLEIDFAFNQDQIGQINANFELNDYVSKMDINNRKNQLLSNFMLNFDSNLQNENINFASSWSIDNITDNEDIYLLIKNLITNTNNEDLNNLIEKFAKYFDENKYIKFKQDENTQKLIDFLTSKEKNIIFEEPLFEAYAIETTKNNETKYLLQPTKYACEKSFDIFNNTTKYYFFITHKNVQILYIKIL